MLEYITCKIRQCVWHCMFLLPFYNIDCLTAKTARTLTVIYLCFRNVLEFKWRSLDRQRFQLVSMLACVPKRLNVNWFKIEETSTITRGNWCQTSNVIIILHGGRGGVVVRGLASFHCGSGSIPARSHTWVDFVVGSLPRVFSPDSPSFFLSSTKSNISQSQSDQDRGPACKSAQLGLMWLPL